MRETMRLPEWKAPDRPECLRGCSRPQDEGAGGQWSEEQYFAMDAAFRAAVRREHPEPVDFVHRERV